MILVLTDKNDSHANHVLKKIELKNLPYYRLNLDVASLLNTYVTFNGHSWLINQNDQILILEDIKCVWHRRTFVELLIEEQYDQTADFKIWKNEWNKTLLGIYVSLRNKAWLNPWRKAYEAENKYLQMELAKKNGLELPITLVSNNKTELIDFHNKEKDVVLKLMHQDFYKNENNEHVGLYVNKVSLETMGLFKTREENPIVLQKYTKKDFEVRYTVVGYDHYVCKIESQKSEIANIDWRRYDIPNTPHSPIDPPQKIREGVTNLMRDLGIEYGALDFIVDHDGKWWFLEVNSMGQFLWIEDLAGLDISNGIVNWLEKSYF